MQRMQVCVYICAAAVCTEEGRGSTLTHDLTKYYRYVTGKSILCYVARAWDCHSLHEALLAFGRCITARARSWHRFLLARTRSPEIAYVLKYTRERHLLRYNIAFRALNCMKRDRVKLALRISSSRRVIFFRATFTFGAVMRAKL